MFFIAAALVAAWYGGFGSGIAALALGLWIGDYFFMPSGGAVSFSDPVQVARVARYVLTASIGIFLIEIMHRGKRRTAAMVVELEQEIERRKKSEAEVVQAKVLLSKHAEELEERVAERTAHLEATIQSLESVLYHMAHSLRAPLRAMEGFATLLVEEYAPRLDETGVDFSRRIAQAAKQMDILLEDLMAYGRLGQIEVRVAETDLNAALGNVLSRLEKRIEVAKAEIRVQELMPKVKADAVLIDQVLFNLLENALTFVAPGVTPRIEIRAESLESVVRVWIEDNGIGIAPEYHGRIFQPFEFVPTQGVEASTGMGLAVVAKAMERMRGKVGVESKPGDGSRFWLEFSRADQ
jgi:signal transduction histidine kinase